MYACLYDSYLVLHFWQDLYEESQAKVEAIERQLAALEVDDDEEGADEDDESDEDGDKDGDDAADDGADGEE